MYKNEEKVKELQKELTEARAKVKLIENKMFQEKRKVPEGYKLIEDGEEAQQGVIGYNSQISNWAIQKTVIGCIHPEYPKLFNGWLFANPVKK